MSPVPLMAATSVLRFAALALQAAPAAASATLLTLIFVFEFGVKS